jgi:catechol 2,3-dioxygenase-like lactoylglutathione lyase family enzyme
MMSDLGFLGMTVQVAVPNFTAGLDFYSRLFGCAPEFKPYDDFAEWEAVKDVWFQLAEGEPRPAHAARFRVNDIATAVEWVERELGVRCAITRIPGLVAFCNFADPWGNNLGFYQRLWTRAPRNPGGRSEEDTSRTEHLRVGTEA